MILCVLARLSLSEAIWGGKCVNQIGSSSETCTDTLGKPCTPTQSEQGLLPVKIDHAGWCPQMQKTGQAQMWIHVLWLAVSDFFPFFGPIAEQLPGQQSWETAGPQVHSGSAHQYNLLQNEGIVSFSSIFILKLGAELDLRLFFRSRNGENSANQLGFLHIVYLSCRISHFPPDVSVLLPCITAWSFNSPTSHMKAPGRFLFSLLQSSMLHIWESTVAKL